MPRRRTPRSEQYYQIKDAAERVGVHPTTVYRWIREDLLPAYEDPKWGVLLVRKEDLDKFEELFLR